jgi:predicted KAP-like P-loop ATPase
MTAPVDVNTSPFNGDSLEREAVAKRIVRLLTELSEAEHLPAGRVLAIDAPWGSGKTWLAARIPALLDHAHERGRALYLNAFEFDFHHDPFVVLASAVLSVSREGPLKGAFKAAAAEVIKTAPAVVGGLVKRSGEVLLGAATVEALEAASTVTEHSIKRLLDTFAETQKSTAAFKKRLAALADELPGPFVILIDELDRCRPTFALEMLERIKHLFDVPKVVFALFIHGEAIHSAISKEYGQGIDPARGSPKEYRALQSASGNV